MILRSKKIPAAAGWVVALLITGAAAGPAAALHTSWPIGQRGQISAERKPGTHDANNIVTLYYNFGQVGDYPLNPQEVNLNTFHSVEVPKGTGMNYSDGITPFVLERFHPLSRGVPDTSTYNYVMETGYREREALGPDRNFMRYEPRPGFEQADPDTNVNEAPAISNDPRTWPTKWPDKMNDAFDQGWPGSWDGYFGKRPAADEESFFEVDDDRYVLLSINPDSTDITRRGLALRMDVRGFQWSNAQAGNVIFWHYDITNEGTTTYPDMIFGLYMDSGVGGSQLSCDNVYESDDDNAFFDKSLGLNLVYTYDSHGHGVDATSTCAPTGYLGYAYLETPGNSTDGIDNDRDGMTDESRTSGPGVEIPPANAALTLAQRQDAIRAYVYAHYDTTNFFQTYGPLEKRPAFKSGYWWTGDEDLDWNIATDDVGADGVPNTHDPGEGDGIPTAGEPNFDQTDLHESDQIGLTGFKMNRIAKASGNPDPTPPDGITFANTDGIDWPAFLYAYWTNPVVGARFDSALVSDWNIAFFFASGTFPMIPDQSERFSLALAYGPSLTELRTAVHVVQLIYNANYQFATPPQSPTVTAETADGKVRLTWDNAAERSIDPITFDKDFEGYRIYRSTDYTFLDPLKVSNGTGSQMVGYVPSAQFDLVNGIEGYSRMAVNGVQYWLGTDSGIQHTWTDSSATNGQLYFYAVCAYDHGFDTGNDSTSFYPAENPITVSLTARGTYILPSNVVMARPEPHVAGWEPATATNTVHGRGAGRGSVNVQVVNSNLVPQNHLFAVGFGAPDTVVRAQSYWLRDSTAHKLYFLDGTNLKGETDVTGQGVGPTGAGLLPVVNAGAFATVDTARTGLRAGSPDTLRILINPSPFVANFSLDQRRQFFPTELSIVFDDVVQDTSVKIDSRDSTYQMKFRVYAHTDSGDVKLKVRFFDKADHDGTLSQFGDFIDILSYALTDTLRKSPVPTWRFALDSASVRAHRKPHLGDVFDLKIKLPLTPADIFTFSTGAQSLSPAAAAVDWRQKPYVVPNPYVDAASFEPKNFLSDGRGDRRIEFRSIPTGAMVRIYTVHGDLVQTLRQDGSTSGYVPWNLKTKDNLDVAPGLYVFQVEAPGLGKYIGKFALIK